MKKPDRFERMVENLVKVKRGATLINICLYKTEVVNLLRREHRAVVRVIEEEMRIWDVPSKVDAHVSINAFGKKCRVAQCQDILSKLQKRAK